MPPQSRRPRGLSANHANENERLETIKSDKSTLSSIRLLGKENWVKIDERPHCFYCARKFRPFFFKRHCRSCGEIVCSTCYRRRRVRVTSTLEVTVRLCFDCIDKAMLLAESKRHLSTHKSIDHHSFSNDGLRTHFDSTKTTSSSICSRFSDFSTCNWSDSDSDLTDTSSRSSVLFSSQRSSRRHLSNLVPTDVIEFLPDDELLCLSDARQHDTLQRLHVFDSTLATEYNAICDLVRQVFNCTIAAVAFMDENRQWYKARHGITASAWPRDATLCSQLMHVPHPTIILDATQDARFQQHPLVTGSASIRFYATTPICDPETGLVIGSIFVMDPTPKQQLPPRGMEILSYASNAIEKLLQGVVILRPSIQSVTIRPGNLYPQRESMPCCSERDLAWLQSVPEELESNEWRSQRRTFALPAEPRRPLEGVPLRSVVP